MFSKDVTLVLAILLFTSNVVLSAPSEEPQQLDEFQAKTNDGENQGEYLGSEQVVDGPEEVNKIDLETTRATSGETLVVEEHVSRRSYDQINRYLVQSAGDLDDDSTLLKAVEFLESDPKRGSLLNGHLKAALKQFTALKAIKDGSNKCSASSYEILLRNDRATGGRTHSKRSNSEQLNKVERIVYKVALQHALDCQEVYPLEFKRRYAELDRELVRSVEEYLRSVQDIVLQPTDKENEETRRAASRELARQRTLRPTTGFASAKVLYKVIEALASKNQDPDLEGIVEEANLEGKKEVNREKLRQLFNKYLVKPCQYYVEKLGPGLFIQADYDGEMLEYNSFYAKDSAEVTDFLIGLDGYHLCDFLVDENDWVQNDLFRNLVKVAKRAP